MSQLRPTFASRGTMGQVRLEPVSHGSHDPGSQTHRAPHGTRQLGRTQSQRRVAMPRFVRPHRLDERASTGIPGRKALEVPGEMLFDLPFGFREESQVPAIAVRSGDGADGERAGVPDGIEPVSYTHLRAHETP